MAAEAPLEVRHKGQQSADSGAYLEWATESVDPAERSYQSNVTGEFVTVVAVEQTQQQPSPDVPESSFVTVLEIGDKKDQVEEVLVYRLPGERLGFGLKFEGGLKTAERVNRLFIQSCASDSPASRTRCSWGPLMPGDEILEIDGVEVKSMTRIDCVRSLKESNVVIKLKVKQHKSEDREKEECKNSPPPIPPRKVPRRNSSQKGEPAIVNPPDGFTDESNREIKLKSVSPKAIVKNNHDDRQNIPEAEVYLDLIAKESEILPGESESDDTGSSISTVVDRLSSAPTTSNSSFSDVRSITSLDITTPPTPTTTNTCPTFDLDRVLEPFLQLEREFSSSATIDESSLFNKLVAAANFTEPSHISLTRSSSMNSGTGGDDGMALKPPVSFQDEPGNRANFDGERMPLSSAEIFEPIKESPPTIKASPRKSHNIVLNLSSDSDVIPTTNRISNLENQNGKDAPALPPKPTPRKELCQKNKFKSGKKRPPPPPPPRSDRPLCPDPQGNPQDFRSEADLDSRNEVDHHLPRLIDFVPKDRTDLVVPNAIHPENSQQNHMELLIQRQRILEMMSPQSTHDTVDHGKGKDEDGGSDASEGEEHCSALPMCVPVVESDEEAESFVPTRSANLTTIGEDEEEHTEQEVLRSPPVPTIEEPSAEDQDEAEGADSSPQDDEGTELRDISQSDIVKCLILELIVIVNFLLKKTGLLWTSNKPSNITGECVMEPRIVFFTPKTVVKKQNSLEPVPIANVQTPDSQQVSKTPEKPTDTVECGAMDTSASATLSLSPPPSFSRLPPDGHEFPPNYQELCPELAEPSLKMQPPPPLPTTAPPIPKKKFSVPILEREIENTVPARKYSTCSNPATNSDESSKPSRGAFWRNDEKSVRSVRDKIAMFSNVTDETPVSPAIPPPSLTAHRKLNRFKSSEDVLYDNVDGSSGNLNSGKLFSRSVVSVDKVTSNSYLPEINQRSTSPMKKLPTYSSMVDMSQVSTTKQVKSNVPKSLELTSRTQSSMDLSSSSSAYSSESPDSSLTSSVTTPTPYVGYSSTLPRKTAARENERKISLTSSPASNTENKTSLGRAMSFSGTNKLHSRSQSLVDVNSIPLNRYMPKNNSEEARRASLNALIEQRRRSISKLRGLVIPEKVSEDVPQTIPDLPEIKSRDSILSKVPEETVKKSSFSSYGSCRYGNSTYSTPATNISSSQNNNLTSLSWKTQPPVADIPKYSPAFKRKSLAVYGTPSLASSVSSSLSSSREELRPIFDNTVSNNVKPSVTPPPPPSKPPRSVSNVSRSSFSSPTVTSLSPTPSHHEPPKSLESITSPTQSDLSFEFISSSGSSPDMKMMRNNHYEDKINQKNGNYKSSEPQVMPLIKLNKQQNANDLRRSGGEESDNDSAVSSSRSSISHDFSPPQSPLPDLQHRIGDEDHMSRSHMLLSPSNSAGSSDRRTLRRTLSSETTASAASSTASTLTSGSQASCSSSSTDSLNRRVLKAQSVEAINRKNVLSSARFSSGQDLKIGSPLIQRKFDEGEGYVDEGVHKEVDIDEIKTHIETENFIEKLNGTLKREIVTEDLCEENSSPETIHYQLSSSNNEFRSMKVAYLEVEVSDGGNFSSQDDSSFIDSNPSSMEHLDSDPVPAPREKILSKENGYTNQEIFLTDSVDGKIDNFTKHSSKYDSTAADLYNKNIVKNSPSKKPFIKRLSRETIMNNNSSASDDDSCKTALSQNKINNTSKPNLVSAVPPKPVERKNSSQALLHSDSKESTTSSEDFASCTSKQETPTLSPKESPGSSSTGKIPTVSSRNANNSRRSVSVNDIRKAFEKAEIALSGKPKTGMLNGNGHLIPSHARVSSLDSTTSEDSCAPTPTHYGSITNLQKEQQFGSITSLASSTSLISQQELQQLIEDANQTLEETGGCSHEVVVVILHRDTAGGSVGITLAGGADYEAKEITVHKVLAGSPADRDGRIQKGDRILSINGRSMKGVSHRESLAILKAPRPEVVLVVSRWRPDGHADPGPAEDPLVLGLRNSLRPPRIPEQHPDDPASDKDESVEEVARGPPLTVTLVKDGAGLGFSLEGGKDSPLGDQPLTIKKIFTGGCAEKSGQLFAGDELLSVNGTDVTSMSRIEAWGLMKRLADGKVVLSVRHKTIN